MLRIFFDTEFTDLVTDPRLISIGLVSEDGARTFYAELSDTWRPEYLGDFAREAVLPQLEGGAVRLTMAELSEQLRAWLEAFGEPVRLVTDSLSWDWPWIQEIFEDLDAWPPNLDGKPLILTQETEFNLATERAFSGGLRRHHALDDAKANRLGWIAAGCDIERTP
ncbi:MAG: 3'-5' exoribonuclease domain-containing protein [Sulfuricella sp.]